MSEGIHRTLTELDAQTSRMIKGLLDRRGELLEALTEVATYQSAVDELHRSIRVLAGAPWELTRNEPQELDHLAVFLPSNNILYSYTLFCLVPSLYSRRITARSSTRVRAVAERVHAILGDLTDGTVQLTTATQRQFTQLCATADAVVFTGQPDNARQVVAAVGAGPRVLAFGSGPNPFVVGPEADVSAAVRDLVSARLYNSGQDCLCPDVTFVHSSVAAEFVEALSAVVSELRVGDRRDPATLVAPIVYPDAVEQAEQFLTEHRRHVRVGGQVRADDGVVEPAVVTLPWIDDFDPPEFFAPVFAVVEYYDAHQLGRWFTSDTERQRGMYASVYGEPDLPHDLIGTTAICRERTTFDIEDGNRPFGGYGVDAGCVHTAEGLVARPLLLSAELRGAPAPVVAPVG